MVSRSTVLSVVDKGGGAGARGWVFFALYVRCGNGWFTACLSSWTSWKLARGSEYMAT